MRTLVFLSTATGFGNTAECGGGEYFASEFLQELHRRGWQITLCCPSNSPLLGDITLRSALRDVSIVDISAKISTPMVFFFNLAKWLQRIPKFGKCILYGNGFESLKWISPAAQFFSLPAFCHLHESCYASYASWRARILSRSVSDIFAISNTVRDRFIEGAKFPAESIHLTPNGVHIEAQVEKRESDKCALRQEFDLPPHSRIISMAARTNPLKGHAVFINAAKRVHATHPSTRFLIVGLQDTTAEEQSLYTAMMQMIAQEDLSEIVRTCPMLPLEQTRRIMRCSDIFVVPSTSEGFGRTAIEAMAERTPLVASAVGGLLDIVADGTTGLLFPPCDDHALASKITAILEKPILGDRIARAGHDAAIARYSIRSMTDRIEVILRKAIEN